MKQQLKKNKSQGCKPVRAVVFLFFALFLLSNCQIKKSLSDALLDQSSQAHTTGRIEKGLPSVTTATQQEACELQSSSAYADQDLRIAVEAVSLPMPDLFVLSYLPFLLDYAGFSVDAHRPLADLFKVLLAESGSPIYIKNRYLLI